MSDYDLFPLTFTGKMGLEMMKQPGFKSWIQHVPALIHADQDSWNKIARMMMDVISPDVDFYISDMNALKYLHDHFSEEEMGVTLWTHETTDLFPHINGGARPEIDCVVVMSRLAAHLSHHGTTGAYHNKTYPEINGVPVKKIQRWEYRPNAANIMMNDYQERCVLGRNDTNQHLSHEPTSI